MSLSVTQIKKIVIVDKRYIKYFSKIMPIILCNIGGENAGEEGAPQQRVRRNQFRRNRQRAAGSANVNQAGGAGASSNAAGSGEQQVN